MAVNEDLSAYSTSAASNTPAGGSNVGPDLDNHLRDIKRNVRRTAERFQGATTPEAFRGRDWLDTSGTAATKLELTMNDGSNEIPYMDFDTSAGTARPIIDGTTVPADSMAIQAKSSVDIDGGAIDGAIVGANSAAAGTFTALTANDGTTAQHVSTLSQLQDGEPYYYISTGSANALVIAATPAWTAYAQGKVLIIKKNTLANTGAVTLNVDSNGLRAVVDQAGAALVGGEMLAGGMYILEDDGTSFILMNPARSMRTFRAILGADQTGVVTSTVTKIEFDTEVFDSHGEYDASTNYRWIPQQPGYYQIGLTIRSTGLADGKFSQVYIYKNGSEDSTRWEYMPSANGSPVIITALIYLDGDTDYVEPYWQHDSGSNESVQVGSSVFWGVGPF